MDLGRVREAMRSAYYKLVEVVHSETSTGTRYELPQLSQLCHEHGALLMVDAISSVACMELRMDEWDLDLVVTTTNKGMGSLVGLAMVAVSRSAFDAMDARETDCQSFGLDIKRWRTVTQLRGLLAVA